MSATDTFSAVIADDEPLLVDALERLLATVWPELRILAKVHNGIEAINAIHACTPDIVFLDIQMPGADGIEVAQTIAEDWQDPANDKPVPLVVFATAFDDYAIRAFESAAIDYLLKPVKQTRLEQTVLRLKGRLPQRDVAAIDTLASQLQQLINAEKTGNESTECPPRLQVVKASSGNQVRIIPVEDVILFESADKYVSVYTEQGESLIREPLKNLLPQLDPERFVQIHRGAIVNMAKVAVAHRDDTGKVTLELKGTDKQAAVSRVYRHLFQPM